MLFNIIGINKTKKIQNHVHWLTLVLITLNCQVLLPESEMLCGVYFANENLCVVQKYRSKQFTNKCLYCWWKSCSWKDLLPKILSVLVTNDLLNHSGVEMSGSEYKSEIIRTLVMMQWHPSVVTSLASMFT